MGNIDFNDYKVVVFENGEPVFFGKKDEKYKDTDEEKTHGDLIIEYIDKKLQSDDFKDHPQLNQLKNCTANIAMAAQVLFFTDGVFVLNTLPDSYIMFKEDANLDDLQVIKDYAEDIEKLGKPYLFKVGLAKDEFGGLFIQDQMIMDDQSLPLIDRIDTYLNSNSLSNLRRK